MEICEGFKCKMLDMLIRVVIQLNLSKHEWHLVPIVIADYLHAQEALPHNELQAINCPHSCW